LWGQIDNGVLRKTLYRVKKLKEIAWEVKESLYGCKIFPPHYFL